MTAPLRIATPASTPDWPGAWRQDSALETFTPGEKWCAQFICPEHGHWWDHTNHEHGVPDERWCQHCGLTLRRDGCVARQYPKESQEAANA